MVATLREMKHLDGRHDFDFLIGTWQVANRKLSDPVAASSATWLSFAANSEERPILGGLGNIEMYRSSVFPARGNFEALALRLFEPETGLWRIWWTSTARPGTLEVPMVGKFVEGRGQFEADDVIESRAVKVRFEWLNLSPSSARWAQAFSFDGGASWNTNWIMEFTRRPDANE